MRAKPGDRVRRPDVREGGQKFRDSERRQRGAAAQGENFRHIAL
jgi:hypothetical protein